MQASFLYLYPLHVLLFLLPWVKLKVGLPTRKSKETDLYDFLLLGQLGSSDNSKEDYIIEFGLYN